MKDLFKTASGRLTPYALACGYIEQYDTHPGNTQAGQQVTLWREHGVYHVRAHDFTKGARLLWESFDKLTDARRCYDMARRAIRA